MTSAYILVAAVLVLGGIIATLGDRLGSKVGKARLTIFNLRPRQTAVVITVMTGILIAASTLGLLFGLSSSLRDGVFKLDDILKQGRKDLEKLNLEKQQIQQELDRVKIEAQQVQSSLSNANQKFEMAKKQLKDVTKQTSKLYDELQLLNQEKTHLIKERKILENQSKKLEMLVNQRDVQLAQQNSTIKNQDSILNSLKQQQADLEIEINHQDDLIFNLDQEISSKDQALQDKENQREKLEEQLNFLEKQVQILGQYYENYQVLRQGNLGLLRGQILAVGGVRIEDPNMAQNAVDQLLRQANVNALEATANTDQNQQIVQITQAEVAQLITQLQTGKDFVVRIISGGNYLKGETQVRVFADITLNQRIFLQNQMIASVSLDKNNLTQTILQQQLDLLLATTQFRARSAGILGEIQVEEGSITTLSDFVEQLLKMEEIPDQIQAVAINTTYTIGPLKLKLIALRQGQILFSTS